MMRIITILIFSVLLVGCGGGKKDPPKAPDAARLVFPLKSSQCNTGVDVTPNTSTVTFEWQAGANTDSYRLVVINLNTGGIKETQTMTPAASLVIDKGEPFEWYVISSNEKSEERTQSETWRFYNAGAVTTYIPFPAEIVAPESGSSVAVDLNNEISLEWSSSDIDNDVISFEVYYGTVNPPETLVASPSVSITNLKVDAMTNTVYYWRVITIDAEGNSSDSGVFDFRAL